MGLLDRAKKIARSAGSGFMDAPGAVGGALGSAGSTAWDKALDPIWSRTIGELGDKDYQDQTGDLGQAESQRESVLGGIAEKALSSPDWRSDPRSIAIQQQAQAFGLAPEELPLSQLLAQAKQSQYSGLSTLGAYGGREGYEGLAGRNELSAHWWMVKEGIDQAKADASKVEAEWLNVLEGDFANLLSEQRDLGSIQNWNGIAVSAIQMIENSKGKDDEEAKANYAFAMGILNEYQEQLQTHVELEAPGWWDENFEFAEGPSAFNRTASGLARPVLEGLDAVSQTALRGIEATRRGDIFDSDFWTKGGEGAGYTYGGEDGRLNYAEALYGEERAQRFDEAAGDWAPIVNLAGEIAVDPLTYVTLGSTRAGRIAEGAVTRQAAKAGSKEAMEHAQAILAQLKKGGLDSLEQLDRIQLERWMLADAKAVAASQGTGVFGKQRQKIDAALRKADSRMEALDAKATKIAEKHIENIGRGGQAGIGLGGRTLVAYNDIPGIRRLMDDFEIGTKSKLVETGESQTFRRAEEFTEFDDVTSTRFRPTAGETTGMVDESIDPRISKLRAKAADEAVGADEAAAFTAKADELADRLRQGVGDPQTEIKWIEEEITERIARQSTKWIEDTIPLLDEQLYSTIIKRTPGLARRIAEVAPFAAVRRRLIPRAGMLNRVGRTQAQAFHTELRRAQGEAFQATRDIQARLQGKLGRDVLKDFGGDQAAMSDFLNKALSNADQMISARLRFGVDTNTGKLLNALEDARRQIWETLSPEQRQLFGNENTYLPRVLSENGRKLLNKLDAPTLAALNDVAPELAKLARSIQDDAAFGTARIGSLADDPFTRMRTIAPDIQDLREVNKAVAEHLEKAGIKLDDLFEDNVLVAWGTRSEAAFRARIVGEIKDGMTNLLDDDGNKLIVGLDEYKSLDSAAKLTLTESPTDIFGDMMYVNKELADEMTEVTEILLDPAKRDMLGKAVNEVNGLWARYATLSPGFHARNSMGNIFNAFLAGVRNPIRYADAMQLQRQHQSARKIMGRTGMTFEQSLAQQMGKLDNMKVGAARAGRNLDEHILDHIPEARVLKDMEHHKVIDGLFGDVFESDAAQVQKAGLKGVINPRVRTGANITHLSRKVGNAIEHNARAAVYLDQIAKGVAPAAAAAHVRQYLFDYQDLTRFESGIRRNVSRFYTWMRKNTALQLDTLVRTPGKIVNAQKVVEEALTQIFGGEDRSSMLPPQWAQAAGLKVRDGGNAIGIETPFYSAMNTTEDILALPTAVAIEMGLPVPESVEEAIGWHGVQDAAQSALGLFSGLPKAAADALYGQATGYDPFTGAALKFDDTPGWLKVASIVNPAFSRLERLKKDVDEGFEGLDWVHWLAGVQVYDQERISNSASNTLKFQMQEMIANSKKGDAPWASMDDLRRESRIDTVNRFMHIMAYGGDYGEDPQMLMEQLQGIVPKEVLELFGFDPADRRFSSEMRPLDDEVSAQRGLVEAIDALEVLMERPLSQDEKLQVLLMSTNVYDSEIEELGIEPVKDYSDGGVFAPEDAPDARDPLGMLTGMGAAIGLDVSQMQAARPMLDDVERLKQQAAASGAMPGQIDQMVANYVIGEMSRTKLGNWFGPDVLPTHGWMGYDDRDSAYDQTRGWQDAAQFSFLYQVFNDGKMPTQDMIDQAVIQANMGKTDLRGLAQYGIGPGPGAKIPNRKNIQTDQEMSNDALRELQSLQQGTRFGPWVGPKPEASPLNELQLGGAGLPIVPNS